jgi:thioredoxin-dependent peroxiredoxin
MKLRIGLAVALFAALGFMFKLSSASSDPPAAGQSAPVFTLPSQDGSPVSLEQYRGKWVLLYFYPKDNTAGCTIEAHNFQRDLPKYESLDAVVLGVSLDSQDSHQSFCTKQGLTFKLLSDTERQVSAQYGSLRNILGLKMAARNTFLIDPTGKIAQVWLGVSPSSHSADVLKALEHLKRDRVLPA